MSLPFVVATSLSPALVFVAYDLRLIRVARGHRERQRCRVAVVVLARGGRGAGRGRTEKETCRSPRTTVAAACATIMKLLAAPLAPQSQV